MIKNGINREDEGNGSGRVRSLRSYREHPGGYFSGIKAEEMDHEAEYRALKDANYIIENKERGDRLMSIDQKSFCTSCLEQWICHGHNYDGYECYDLTECDDYKKYEIVVKTIDGEVYSKMFRTKEELPEFIQEEIEE